MFAGDIADSYATYIVRSKVMGFPDFISLRVIEAGDHLTQVDVFSRSRFGYSDLGVNEKRVLYWQKALRENLRT